MIDNIKAQIDNIDKSLRWIKKNKPSDYEQRFFQLVEERRKLKKMQTANEDNPAIAAFGVSQVGKSYLMNCMLQKDGESFIIKADGRTYKFIEEMNPKTNGTEATGVVTRFTSFSRSKNKYSKEYPILMKCLTVTDIILILSDSYYNDISDYTTYSEAVITELSENLYSKYIQKPVTGNFAITPDDIMDMRAYYSKHVNNAQAFLHTSFFEQLALIIDRIPSEDWVDVFSVLWHKSEFMTKLLRRMLDTLAKLGYSRYVYLPAQAMLHKGINEDTVMSVQCLNDLFLDAPRFFTDAYVSENNGYRKIGSFAKSEICAVCAEIIVKIDDTYLRNVSRYSFCNITDPRVQAELSKGRDKVVKVNTETGNADVSYEITLDVLKENDMLDFPGARSRKKEILETLNETTILINVLLRGKVAYLFNCYNESMLINILLYCHHAEQNDVTDIPHLLKDWIMNYVGDTMEKRRRTLEMTDGISPFFYIGTKFNLDMREDTEEIANGINALKGRWQQRFEKVLYHQCFNADGCLDAQKKKIFLNWTRNGENFNNSYILRDFKYSGPLASKLYDHENTEKRVMTISEEHYRNLRETFCQSEAVRRFFADPQLSWDVCASIDNDGSQYILSQLAKVAACMSKTRNEQFKAMLEASSRKVLDIMEGYFISTDADELLESNVRKAKNIFREMDFACNADNYYFGHLLQALQIGEPLCYRVVHQVMQDPEKMGKANDFNDYEIIRNSCRKSGHPIEDAKTPEEKWQCVIDTYGFKSREDAEDFLTRKGVDIQRLFDGSYIRKLNSFIIGDAVYDKWCSRIKSVDFLNEFTDEERFDRNILTLLVDNLLLVAKSVNLRDRMADSIAEYVNVVDIHVASESLIADLLASLINDFIMDFGYRYLSEDKIENARDICMKRNLPAFNYILRQMPATYDEEGLAELFTGMTDNPMVILPSFDDNYNKWLEYMFISFVANLDAPDFDHEANQELSAILEEIKSV